MLVTPISWVVDGQYRIVSVVAPRSALAGRGEAFVAGCAGESVRSSAALWDRLLHGEGHGMKREDNDAQNDTNQSDQRLSDQTDRAARRGRNCKLKNQVAVLPCHWRISLQGSVCTLAHPCPHRTDPGRLK